MSFSRGASSHSAKEFYDSRCVVFEVFARIYVGSQVTGHSWKAIAEGQKLEGTLMYVVLWAGW